MGVQTFAGHLLCTASYYKMYWLCQFGNMNKGMSRECIDNNNRIYRRLISPHASWCWSLSLPLSILYIDLGRMQVFLCLAIVLKRTWHTKPLVTSDHCWNCKYIHPCTSTDCSSLCWMAASNPNEVSWKLSVNVCKWCQHHCYCYNSVHPWRTEKKS